jgi:hypothetical protein
VKKEQIERYFHLKYEDDGNVCAHSNPFWSWSGKYLHIITIPQGAPIIVSGKYVVLSCTPEDPCCDQEFRLFPGVFKSTYPKDVSHYYNKTDRTVTVVTVNYAPPFSHKQGYASGIT